MNRRRKAEKQSSLEVDEGMTFSMTIFKPCHTKARAKSARINEDRRPDTLAEAQAILSGLAALRSVPTAGRDRMPLRRG